MLKHTRLSVAALLAMVGGLVACTGTIDGTQQGNEPSGPAPVTPTGNAGSAPIGTDPLMTPVPTSVVHAQLHKLTSSAFANSLRDLLGAEVPISDVEPDTEVDDFTTIGGSTVSISAAGVGQYEAAIDAALAWAFSDAMRAKGIVSCVPQGATDADCLNRAVQTFGRRAFRRPLTATETTRFVGVAGSIGEESKDAMLGLRYALSAILQAPPFLYRVELGAPSAADGGRLKFTDYEMTSRLAAAIWNSTPDDALLDAAGRGELGSAAGVTAQVERMLAAPYARAAFSTFVDDLYGVERLLATFKDAGTFPEWTKTLPQAMHEELTRRVQDLVFDAKGDYLSLYDSKTVFVNDELAKLYGLPALGQAGFRKVELASDSPRVGLLGSGAVLAAYALPQRTSPTARGKFVNMTFLCRSVPPPPAGVDTTLPPPADPDASLRERLATHRTNPLCASCHAMMDPIGLGLENFDSLGRYRDTENGRMIDASGEVNGVKFSNARELGEKLRADPAAAACFVKKLYAYEQGRSATDADEAALTQLAQDFATGGNRADRLLVSLVSSDAFRFVQPKGL